MPGLVKKFELQTYDKTLLQMVALEQIGPLVDNVKKIYVKTENLATDFKRLTLMDMKSSDFYDESLTMTILAHNIATALQLAMENILRDTYQRISDVKGASASEAEKLASTQTKMTEQLSSLMALGDGQFVGQSVSAAGTPVGANGVTDPSLLGAFGAGTLAALQNGAMTGASGGAGGSGGSGSGGSGGGSRGGGSGGAGSPQEEEEKRIVAVEGEIPDEVAGSGALDSLIGLGNSTGHNTGGAPANTENTENNFNDSRNNGESYETQSGRNFSTYACQDKVPGHPDYNGSGCVNTACFTVASGYTDITYDDYLSRVGYATGGNPCDWWKAAGLTNYKEGVDSPANIPSVIQNGGACVIGVNQGNSGVNTAVSGGSQHYVSAVDYRVENGVEQVYVINTTSYWKDQKDGWMNLSDVTNGSFQVWSYYGDPK